MADDVKAKPGSNGFDPDALQSAVSQFEELEAQAETVMAEARNKVKTIRTDQKDILDEAKDAHDIPKAELKAVLARRKTWRKFEKLRDGRDEDSQNVVDQIEHQLGDLKDTPLGMAAMKEAA